MLDGGGVNHEVGKARRDDPRHLCDVAQLPAHPERVVGGQILGFEVLCSCAAHRFLDVHLAGRRREYSLREWIKYQKYLDTKGKWRG